LSSDPANVNLRADDTFPLYPEFWSIFPRFCQQFSQKSKIFRYFQCAHKFCHPDPFMEVWGGSHFFRFIQSFRAILPRFRQASSSKSFTAPLFVILPLNACVGAGDSSFVLCTVSRLIPTTLARFFYQKSKF
jgi:hypothetical protein